MKKNIGLITWYGSKNYGTNVQVYALYKKIKELGYPCDLIAAFNSIIFPGKLTSDMYYPFSTLKKR